MRPSSVNGNGDRYGNPHFLSRELWGNIWNIYIYVYIIYICVYIYIYIYIYIFNTQIVLDEMGKFHIFV